MNQPSWPTREEVRLVGVNIALGTDMSAVLQQAICYADIGWLDAPGLFSYLERQGLEPAWLDQSAQSAMHVLDPLAGAVLLHCGSATVSLH